ncbi:hypothetical protein MNBD_NITROSPINAE01-1787 [hydrothermal vent metagenome]|uniref:Cytochrome b5 heme-binding domain-containing protein n=1 Tax=hydrothermal vent metagenome TaxID=652676 RepID=A0A3B1C2Q3_9ZZZZ
MTKMYCYPKRIFLFFIIFFSSLLYSPAFATPDHAEETRQGCIICHETEEGEALSDRGLSYLFSGYTWPPPENAKAFLNIKNPLRSIIGFFHILFAITWFGTIIYVHIILKPAYASSGLPKSEVRLGVISMAVLGITGTLLMLSRINGLDVLFDTRWGILLLTKIAFYLFLVSSAIFVLTYIKPRLLIKEKTMGKPANGVYNAQNLEAFDGKDGNPAYIAYKGQVHDLSGLARWKGGVHFKHLAGKDLTEELKRAPHGAEKLENLKVIGSYDPLIATQKTFAQKLFYFLAYLNLAVVFVTLFVIAMWRWGI